VLTREEAKRLVYGEINASTSSIPDEEELVILDDLTIEKPWGWVFFCNSRQFAETGNFMDSLLGNAPYIVDRHTGDLLVTGTAYEIEYYIERYEKTGDPHG
jgi:hypothetical protein